MAEDDDEGEEEPLACHKLAKQIAVVALLMNEAVNERWTPDIVVYQYFPLASIIITSRGYEST